MKIPVRHALYVDAKRIYFELQFMFFFKSLQEMDSHDIFTVPKSVSKKDILSYTMIVMAKIRIKWGIQLNTWVYCPNFKFPIQFIVYPLVYADVFCVSRFSPLPQGICQQRYCFCFLEHFWSHILTDSRYLSLLYNKYLHRFWLDSVFDSGVPNFVKKMWILNNFVSILLTTR